MTVPRAARRDDLEQILALDREYSPVYAQVESYGKLLDGDGLLLVTADAGGVYAFAAFSRVLDEATLLNLVVAPDRRRRGAGCALLDRARQLLAQAGVRRLLLELRESNSGARALYRTLGFTEDGVRKAYYHGLNGGDREDALLMSAELEMNCAGS